NGVANEGGVYSTSLETDEVIKLARSHVAQLLDADDCNIVFGENMSTLAFRVSRLISQDWQRGDGHIVTTDIDHHANIDPWESAAELAGIGVKRIGLNKDNLTLDIDDLNDIINEETKLVALGLAS